MMVDAYTLADDLTFEPGNPDSIRNSLANARENARQVRNVVDEDLWSCLNLSFLDLRDIEIADIWKDRPNEFYRRTENAVRTFFGIAGSNMYRDDGWHFLQLGRFVERAQLLAGLIEAQLAVYPSGDPEAGLKSDQGADPDWLSLLRICAARDSYGPAPFAPLRACRRGRFSGRRSAAVAIGPICPGADMRGARGGRRRASARCRGWAGGPAGWRRRSTTIGRTAIRPTKRPSRPPCAGSANPAACSTAISTRPISATGPGDGDAA